MKEGDVRFYKWPDRNGSPIERATIQSVGERCCSVEVGAGDCKRVTIIPKYMLFKFATLASEWAERQKKSDHHSIFGDYNDRQRQSDFNFSAPRPVVDAAGSPTLWVVQGNGGSLFVLDSQEAAEKTADWLFTATGQRCTVRPSRVQTVAPERKETFRPKTDRGWEEQQARVLFAALVMPRLRAMIQKFDSRDPEAIDVYTRIRNRAAAHPKVWEEFREEHKLGDLESVILHCQEEEVQAKHEGEARGRAERAAGQKARQEERIRKYQDVLLPFAMRLHKARFPQLSPEVGHNAYGFVGTFLACLTNQRLRLWLNATGTGPYAAVKTRKQVKEIWDVIREAAQTHAALFMDCRMEWEGYINTTPEWMDVEEASDNLLMQE